MFGCVNFPFNKKLPEQTAYPGRLFIKPGNTGIRRLWDWPWVTKTKTGWGWKRFSQRRNPHDREPCNSKALQRTQTCASEENGHFDNSPAEGIDDKLVLAKEQQQPIRRRSRPHLIKKEMSSSPYLHPTPTLEILDGRGGKLHEEQPRDSSLQNLQSEVETKVCGRGELWIMIQILLALSFKLYGTFY